MAVAEVVTPALLVHVDAEVDLELAVRVTDNAKTQKYSPCNAAESLLVHRDVAAAFLPKIGAVFAARFDAVEPVAPPALPTPVVVVCGSATAVSPGVRHNGQ